MDVDKVLAARSIRPEDLAKRLDTASFPPAPLPKHPLRKEAVLPSLSMPYSWRAELEERRKLALEKTEQLRQTMLQELKEDAQSHAVREGERKRAELLEKADTQTAAAFQDLQSEMTRIAQQYADLKAPLILRRTVLERDPVDIPRLRAPQQQELKQIIARLAALDEEQRTKARALQDSANAEVRKITGNVEGEVDRYVQLRLTERFAEIEKRMASESFDLRLVLPEQLATKDISTTREKVTFDPLLPQPEPARTSGNAKRWAAAERESELRSIRLWAKTKGWLLSETRAGARNVTSQYIAEFVQ